MTGGGLPPAARRTAHSPRDLDLSSAFSCTLCGAKFRTLQALGGHKSKHNGKRKAEQKKTREHPQAPHAPRASSSTPACASPIALHAPSVHQPNTSAGSVRPSERERSVLNAYSDYFKTLGSQKRQRLESDTWQTEPAMTLAAFPGEAPLTSSHLPRLFPLSSSTFSSRTEIGLAAQCTVSVSGSALSLRTHPSPSPPPPRVSASSSLPALVPDASASSVIVSRAHPRQSPFPKPEGRSTPTFSLYPPRSLVFPGLDRERSFVSRASKLMMAMEHGQQQDNRAGLLLAAAASETSRHTGEQSFLTGSTAGTPGEKACHMSARRFDCPRDMEQQQKLQSQRILSRVPSREVDLTLRLGLTC